MEENPQKEQKQESKKGFFKKVWYSIYKIEKYSELSAEGFPRAIKYLAQLILILAILISLTSVYKASSKVGQIAKYIKENVSNFTYSDGTLSSKTEEIKKNENIDFGKIIVDLNDENQEEIDKYINEISENETGVVILKNKIILKQAEIKGTLNYEYKDLFGQIGITEFSKQELVDYLTSTKMVSLYLNLFCIMFIYAFVIYFINTLIDILAVSIFGYIATVIVRMKIKNRAIFNMGVYAITLSTLLNMIYIVVNAVTNYTIQYFDVMYIVVAAIYMIAAIFILKSEFTKKQEQVTKIIEVQNEIKQEKEENKEEQQEEPKEKENNKGKDEKEKKDTDGEEPEGSNA